MYSRYHRAHRVRNRLVSRPPHEHNAQLPRANHRERRPRTGREPIGAIAQRIAEPLRAAARQDDLGRQATPADGGRAGGGEGARDGGSGGLAERVGRERTQPRPARRRVLPAGVIEALLQGVGFGQSR
jgi:hypothetical protein